MRRNHSREFKVECVRQVATGQKRPAQRICREHNLSESLLLRFSRWINTRLTLEALEMALASRRPGAGLIHHSDRGVQYASGEYIHWQAPGGWCPDQHGGRGQPLRENAKAERAESFFRTLKIEEVYLKDYRTFEEAEQNMGHFIEEVYNKKRLHSSLGYLPPVEFEAQHALKVRS